MISSKTLACVRGVLTALVVSAGAVAHADTTGERDRAPRAERSSERREAAQQQRETRQDRRDDTREIRSAVRQDHRDDRRDSAQQQRETRQDRRDDTREIRSAVRQDHRDDRRDTVERQRETRQDRRDDRRDDWRAGHAERRHYPSRGVVIPALPPAHRVVTHRGSRYMFASGVWYRPSGPRFIVIAPPLGIVVPFLPLGYLTLQIGPSRYYYLNDVYYMREPRGYVVVDRPAGTPVYIDDDAPDVEPSLFIYPRYGQSEAQQADDRYECHRWAREQTGFDPSRAMAGWSDAELEFVRADYDRAMGACLDGRGYTVR